MVALIALATVINYIDRQSLSVLWPVISVELYPDLSVDERKEIFGLISIIFVFSYAFGQAIFGKIFDAVGSRIGFALSIGLWSFLPCFTPWLRALLVSLFSDRFLELRKQKLAWSY